LEDLQTAYTQLINGGEISLPPKTSSFQLWASRLAEYATTEGMKAERIYWLDYLDVDYGRLRIDIPQGENIERYQKSKTVSLTEEHTKKLLYEAPTAYKTEINDLLIAALAQLLVTWTGKRRVLIEMEGHGREDLFDSLDVSRTVGWFTSMFPVRIELGEPNNNAVTIKTVKEQLRAIPANGIGYGVLKYFSDEETKEKISNMPVPELSFNYLGQFDQAMPEDGFLGFASESRGPDRDENGKRSSLIDITGGIVRGRLSFEWSYSARQFYPDTIERMANEYIQNLINLIEHCISPEAEGFTPSDFPMAGLNQQELDKLLGKIKK
jgi:microcystin synthetase protein McyA